MQLGEGAEGPAPSEALLAGADGRIVADLVALHLPLLHGFRV